MIRRLREKERLENNKLYNYIFERNGYSTLLNQTKFNQLLKECISCTINEPSLCLNIQCKLNKNEYCILLNEQDYCGFRQTKNKLSEQYRKCDNIECNSNKLKNCTILFDGEFCGDFYIEDYDNRS